MERKIFVTGGTGYVGTALVPVLETLQSGVRGVDINHSALTTHYQLRSLAEAVAARPHAELDAEALLVGESTVATSYSDAPGTPNRRLVFLSRYDGDNADADNDPFTGVDQDLLWLRVQLADSTRSIETLLQR